MYEDSEDVHLWYILREHGGVQPIKYQGDFRYMLLAFEVLDNGEVLNYDLHVHCWYYVRYK